MQALDIPAVCAKAFKLAMTSANIQSAFEVTGIYPFNRHRISDDEFLPSAVTYRVQPDAAAEQTAETTEPSSSVSVTMNAEQTESSRPSENSAAQGN